MFNYYGSKSRVAHIYPHPICTNIIEPFAGSARYSLIYWDREVTLVDKYEVVVRVWKYLQQCSPADIMGLPKLTKGLLLDQLHLSDDERLFLGLIAGVASTSPRNKVSMFCAEQNGRFNKMKRIADNLFKIKHWKIIHGDYLDIVNIPATWFIDPPYQFGGHAYVENKIDFQALGEWCKQRQGQSIVCENTKAIWLPFKPMSKMRGANLLHTTEAIWSNLPTAFDAQQQMLF